MTRKQNESPSQEPLSIPSFLMNPTSRRRAEAREPEGKAATREEEVAATSEPAKEEEPELQLDLGLDFEADEAQSEPAAAAEPAEEPEAAEEEAEKVEEAAELDATPEPKADEQAEGVEDEPSEASESKAEAEVEAAEAAAEVEPEAEVEAEPEPEAEVEPEPVEAAPEADELLPLSPEPKDDEVDAMMQTVMEAAGLSPKPSTPQPENKKAPEDEPVVAPEQAPEPEATSEPEAAPEPEPEPEPKPEPEPTLEEDLATLAAVERRLYAHRYAAAELETFGETIDPAKATADRAEVLAVLVEEDHELLSKPEVGAMVERMNKRGDELEPVVAAQVRALTRDRRRLVAVPAAQQAKLVRLQSESYEAWLQAKANNDWRSFAPYLDRLVNLQRKIAKAMNPDADPYDTLLDEFEPGANRAFYNAFFARIKRSIVPLLSSISMSGRTLSRSCVEGRFDEARQWILARDLAHMEGIDEDAHFLTSTEHPFSEAMTSNYAVTAGHVDANDLMSNIYTILHEVGHNLYEQGVNPAFNRTSLKGGTSMGMHEAQSRFFENCIGRDRAFIGPLLDLMKLHFPGQLSRVTPNQLYRAVNRVAPTLIRVDADELTYPLHIIVRYEIEQLLMDGKATAREVPKLWADRYHRYIGAEVTSDAEGALQDVHWAQGMFGYFPTYALGNAYAAQLRAKMIEEGLDWNRTLASGDLAPIRAWLQDRVWQYGRSKDAAQIIKDACGEPFNARHYANYLTKKYTALYNLQ